MSEDLKVAIEALTKIERELKQLEPINNLINKIIDAINDIEERQMKYERHDHDRWKWQRGFIDEDGEWIRGKWQ